MSLIQKLENSYVAILRVVVILVATILLIVAVVLVAMSLKGMLPASQGKIEMGLVDPKDVLAEVTPGEKRSAPDAAKPDQPKANPYLADYEKAYAVVDAFVNKTSKNTLKIEKPRFFDFLDQNIAHYDDDAIKAKFAAGLAGAFTVSLADTRLIARVEKPLAIKPPAVVAPVVAAIPVDGQELVIEQPFAAPAPVVEESLYNESPFVIVDEVMKAYRKMFNQKLTEAMEKQNAAAAEASESKASATMRMYVAGGLFGTFLLVIFLTVAIRIERNLREIAGRA